MVRVEEDFNDDSSPDVVTSYSKNEQVLTRSADTTGDGKLDTVSNYENGIEIRQTRDKNIDGVPDAIVLFDHKGNRFRETFDTNSDGNLDLVGPFVVG